MVDAAKNIFPPLHKKVGLMKQFVRSLDVGDCFKYVDTPFSIFIDEKMKTSWYDSDKKVAKLHTICHLNL